MSNGTIDWTLGLKVRITTLLDNIITGSIYAFCQTTNTITLIEETLSLQGESTSSANTNNGTINNNHKALTPEKKLPNFRIIKTSFVKEVVVIGKSKKSSVQSPSTNISQGTQYRDIFAKADPPIGRTNIAKLSTRAEVAVQAELKRRARIGVGVTKDAQTLFDLLSKTYVGFFCFLFYYYCLNTTLSISNLTRKFSISSHSVIQRSLYLAW